jgi:hypothetical protein
VQEKRIEEMKEEIEFQKIEISKYKKEKERIEEKLGIKSK